jgi:hypothetical protein
MIWAGAFTLRLIPTKGFSINNFRTRGSLHLLKNSVKSRTLYLNAVNCLRAKSFGSPG